MPSRYKPVFNKSCATCVYCSIHDYGYGQELYCDCTSSENDNGFEVIEDTAMMKDCRFYKNKYIEKKENHYQIRQEYINSYIECSSNDFQLLNNYISNPAEIEFAYRQLEKQKNEKLNELRGFIDFFKSELPDVYRKLRREYKKVQSKDDTCDDGKETK